MAGFILEPLLVTNGYNFTNMGRWGSVPQTGFTRTNHEGMDGSVIAAPGLSGPTHGYAAASNYTLLTLPDAFASFAGTKPDLVLIDMGVNDMGRGRDPNYTATNDLSALLNLVFSNAPAATIIVSKPTTIKYSTILTPPYDTYKANMSLSAAPCRPWLPHGARRDKRCGSRIFIRPCMAPPCSTATERIPMPPADWPSPMK